MVWPCWVAGFFSLDTETHCRAVIPSFSGGVHWGRGEDAPTPLQYCLGFEKGALSKRVCCAVNVNTGLK